jgi:hypothetical protein
MVEFLGELLGDIFCDVIVTGFWKIGQRFWQMSEPRMLQARRARKS